MSKIATAKKQGSPVPVGVLAILNMLIVTGLPASSLAVLLPTITKEFGLTAPQAASFSAGVALGMACFVFIAGVLMDKMSTRVLMAIAGVAGGVVVLLRAFADGYAFLYALFPLYGIIAAIATPGTNKMISLWYDKKFLFMMNALLIGGGATSYIIGLNFTLPISNVLGGWKNYYVALAIVMAIIGVLWLVLVRERSSKDAALNKDIEVKAAEKTKFWQNIGYVISSPKVWCCTLAESCFGGVISVLIALTPVAIVTSWGLPAQQAAFYSSMANSGSLIGYIVLPLILTRFMSKIDKIWPVSFSMIASITLWAIGITSRNPAVMIPCYALGGFLNGFGYVGPRTLLMELPEVAGLRAGTGLGVFNTVVKFITTGMISLAGFMSVAVGQYDRALMYVMFIGFGGAIFLFLLKILKKRDEKKAKSMEQTAKSMEQTAKSMEQTV